MGFPLLSLWQPSGGKQRWGVICVQGVMRRQGCADITPGRWRRGKGSGKGERGDCGETSAAAGAGSRER